MGLTRIKAAQISDIDFKQAVRVVTITNITLSGGAPNAVDSVNLAVGNRILVAGQTTTSQNGIYTVQTLGTGSNGTWIRSDDTNATGEIEAGMIVTVTEGALYSDSIWELTTDDPIVVGTTGLAFSQITANLTAGTTAVRLTTSGNIVMTVSGTSNVAVFTPSGVAVSANVSAGNLLATSVISTSGNVTGNNVTGNNVIATNAVSVGGLTLQGNSLVSSNAVLTIDPNNSGGSDGTVIIAGNLSVTGNVTYIDSNVVTINDKVINVANNAATASAADGAGLAVGPVGGEYASFTYASSGNVWTISNGANVAGAISATGNITGNYFIGNGAALTGIVTDNVNFTSQANVPPASPTNGDFWYDTYTNIKYQYIETGTSNVWVDQSFPTSFSNITVTNILNGGSNTLGSFGNSSNWFGNLYANSVVSSVHSVSGNVTAAYFLGNGSQLTGVSNYQDSNVSTYLASGTNSANIITTGNVTGGNISTAGSIAVGLVAGNLIPSANVTYNLGNTTNRWKDLWLSNSTIYLGNLTLSGNATSLTVNGADVFTANSAVVSTAGNVTGGNLLTSGLVSAAGNITGTNLFGTLQTSSQLNITQIGTLSSLVSSGNVSAANVNATNIVSAVGAVNAGSFSTAGNVVGGNLLTGGLISATGNITGGNILGGANVNATTHTGTTVSVTGNVNGGNLISAALVQGVTVSASGNVVGGNMTTAGLISATGNITGGNLSGTSIVGTLTTATQTNITSVGTLGSLTVTANVTGGNILTAGLISATGNITGGNLNVTGNIVDTGAMSIITSSNGNITLAPNGTGVVVINTDLRNGQANGVGNIGSATGYFNTAFVKATSAQYADLAELYLADQYYEPGTVLEFGGTEEVHQTYSGHSTKIAGIVSTNPSYIMNASLQGSWPTAVALTGRVPCRVLGPVSKGDVLVSSNIPGVAQRIIDRCWQPGCVIGKSLESIVSTGIQTIEVAVGRF